MFTVIVILAFLMSIVAGIGGNSGNQTMTMIIRAIATGRVTGSNVIPLIKRELLVTFLVGICGSAVTAFFAWFISGSIAIAAVMMAAMIGNMLIGAALAATLAAEDRRFWWHPGVDPIAMARALKSNLAERRVMEFLSSHLPPAVRAIRP